MTPEQMTQFDALLNRLLNLHGELVYANYHPGTLSPYEKEGLIQKKTRARNKIVGFMQALTAPTMTDAEWRAEVMARDADHREDMSRKAAHQAGRL